MTCGYCGYCYMCKLLVFNPVLIFTVFFSFRRSMALRDRTSHPMVYRVRQISQSQMQMLISMLGCRHGLLGSVGVPIWSLSIYGVHNNYCRLLCSNSADAIVLNHLTPNQVTIEVLVVINVYSLFLCFSFFLLIKIMLGTVLSFWINNTHMECKYIYIHD